MSKFLGFLLGIAVALAGPAMFGVLAADGGIKLNAKEMALAYGIGALIFWTVVSYFSGAAALGAALTFGAMIYFVHWIPNRMTNFLNDVPGVTTGMIDGIKQYTLNGVVPILAVISLIFGIQLIVQATQRRRRDRAEADRLQREQELAQAQQEAEVTADYPVAGAAYQPAVDNRFGSNFGNSNYDDLFDEDPAPYPPRNQADDQTAQFATSGVDHDRELDEGRDDTSEYRRAGDEADSEDSDDETVLVPTDRDETVTVPAAESRDEATNKPDEAADAADEDVTVQEPDRQQAAETETVAEGTGSADDETQVAPASAAAAQAASAPATASPAASAPAAPTAAAAASPATPASGVASTPLRPEVPQAAQPEAPKAAAPEVPTAVQPEAPKAAQPEAPKAAAPDAPTPAAPENDAPKAGVAPQYDVATTGQRLERNEQMGQQYRERMDAPHVDDTGEFHVGAFENPPVSEEARPQGPRIMDLPGQFRPAGA